MKNVRRNIERVFCYCRDLKMSWLEHFLEFNKQEVRIRMSWVGNFLKINKRGGTSIRDLRVYIFDKLRLCFVFRSAVLSSLTIAVTLHKVNFREQLRGHPFIAYTTFFKKLPFLTQLVRNVRFSGNFAFLLNE